MIRPAADRPRHLDRWRFPVAPGVTAQIDFYGPAGSAITREAVAFLIRYVDLSREAAGEDGAGEAR